MAPWQERALENTRLALACGADPAMLITAALASSSPSTIEDAFETLSHLRPHIVELVHEGPGDQVGRPARLERELQFDPELARLRPDLVDHEIRGKRLFGELLGPLSFFQVAAWAIGGVELSRSDAELLERLGVNTQLMDPRIWPLSVTRRVAVHGGGLAHALVAGVASLCTPHMAVRPVGGFIRFLDRLERETGGRPLAEVLEEVAARRDKVPGLGRPVIGPDERVPHALALAERFGRAGSPSLRLSLEIDAFFRARKGVRINSAGVQGALMRDMKFSPAAASAFCILYFVVPVLAHSVYAEDRKARG